MLNKHDKAVENLNLHIAIQKKKHQRKVLSYTWSTVPIREETKKKKTSFMT